MEENQSCVTAICHYLGLEFRMCMQKFNKLSNVNVSSLIVEQPHPDAASTVLHLANQLAVR